MLVTLDRVLDVRRLTGGAGRSFAGAAATTTSARTFGGHLVAQALLAAGSTVGEGLQAASLHAVMLRPGDASDDCRLDVDVVRDGRSFATREVVVSQGGRQLALVTTQWHAGEECSMSLDDTGGADLPARPDTQPLPYPAPGVATADLDLRWTDDGPGRALWFRTRAAVADGPHVATALTAYVTDLWLADTVLRRVGRRFDDRTVRASTLEHGLWWHRPAVLDGWLCLRSQAAAAQGGRGLVTADLVTEDGGPLARVVQSVSLRDRPAPTPSPTPSLVDENTPRRTP